MKVYKAIITFLLCFICTQYSGFAQGLYQENRRQGIQLYNNQKYDDAITRFNLAKAAPDKPAQNDIDEWIRKCNQAKQRISDERARQETAERQRLAEQRERERQENARREQERQRQERENANARKAYMDITSMTFGNVKKDGTVINSHGSTLYASDLRYLQPKITYNGVASESKSITLYWKIINPDGSINRNTSTSPSGYTSSNSYTVYPGTGKTITLLGWGNENGGTYNPGTYYFELYYNGNLIHRQSVAIQKKPGEATYLRVDNKTSVSTSFDWDGDTETFNVSTDADEWTTWGVPSWCSIENKTSTSFRIRCQANNSSSERSDYIKVKASDKEVRIDFKQAGKPGPSATVNNLWVDHNVFNGYVKGMKIHIDLNVENMKGRTVKFCVFFYLANNTTKLVGMWGNHICSSATSTSDYDNTHWSDWWIFVPYTNIFGAANANGRYSFDVEIQDTNGHCIGRKDNFQFYQY